MLWDQDALAEHAHVADADLTPVGIASAVGMAPTAASTAGLTEDRLVERLFSTNPLRSLRTVPPPIPGWFPSGGFAFDGQESP